MRSLCSLSAVQFIDLPPDTPAVVSPLYGNQLYRPINTHLPPATPPQWQEIPTTCLEEIIGEGKDCSTWRLNPKFDFTYTWANSSDPVYRPNHKAVKEHLLESRVITNPDASKWHYRCVESFYLFTIRALNVRLTAITTS